MPELTVAEQIRKRWEKSDPIVVEFLLCLKNEKDIESVILHETMEALYNPKHP